MKQFDVVIAGYTCVDLIPDFKKSPSVASISEFFIPGKLIEIDGINMVLGGVVPNTGLAMKKFDRKVFLNGLVGDDFVGKLAIDRLAKYNVSEGIKITDKSGTGFSIVIAPPGVDRIFLESPGCNHIFDASFIDFDAVSKSRMFHFGYPPLLKKFYQNSGIQLADLFSKVQKMGAVTSLDFSLPDPQSESGRVNWQEVMQRVLPHTDIFAPSLEEVLQVMQPEGYKEIIASISNAEVMDQKLLKTIRELGRQIIDLGVRILLVKAGHLGAYLLADDVSSINEKAGLKLAGKNWNNCELWCNAYKADPLKMQNASGAGDTAIAAFLSAILQSENPDSSVKYASMAGRNNLYCKNIYDDLSSWQEMTEEINLVRNEATFF